MTLHRHFTPELRSKLEGFLDVGMSVRKIAVTLGFHRSSIYREIKRGQTPGGCYSAWVGNNYAKKQRYKANHERSLYLREDLAWFWDVLTRKLHRYWSPEQIAGSMNAGYVMVNGKYPACPVSIQTIYDWIYLYHPELTPCLRHGFNRHKRQFYLNQIKRELEKQKHRIDHRPAEVEHKTRYGHWEGDTIVGKHGTGCIATLCERKSKFLISFKIYPNGHTQDDVSLQFSKGVCEYLTRLIAPKYLKTLTLDNGTEMVDYAKITRLTGMDIYFCYPYHSWEKGLIENTNGLVRQYLPKGLSFTTLTQEKLDKIVWEINNRPRKALGFKTPQQVMRANQGLA